MKGKLLIGLMAVLSACSSSETNEGATADVASDTAKSPLFTLLSEEESGFSFMNEVNQSEAFNVITYENFYNGAGVGIGDINNDGLPDVYMVGNTFGGRLYLNKGNMKFEQISEAAGTFVRGYTTSVSFVDINNDGFQDIYLCRSLVGEEDFRANVLFVNNGNNTFTDRAAEYGIADRGFSNQSLFFDYDNDGDLDLYVVNHRVDFSNALSIYDTRDVQGNFVPGSMFWNDNCADRLYRNNGNNTFTDITKSAGIINNDFSLSAVASDLNGDGWTDIYVANDFSSKDHAYINQGNGTFRDELETRFGHVPLSSMGMDIADYNNDGYPDMVNLDMTPEDNFRQKQLKGAMSYDKYQMAANFGFYHQVSRNMLHLNHGDGTFSEIGQLAGMAYTDWSWSSLFADLDNDGWQDLFISNGHFKDITDLDYLKYRSVEAVQKAGGNDHVSPMNLINLMTSTKIPNYAYGNNRDLRFVNRTKEWGLDQPSHSNGAAWADLDGDGDLDLVVNNFNQSAFLYRNESRERDASHYVQVALKGEKGNLGGYGAKVEITTASGLQMREMTPYRGFVSSVEPILHFGLGPDEVIDRLVVTWPGGKQQVLTDVKSDQRITLQLSDATQKASPKEKTTPLLAESGSGLNYRHVESGYNDFKQEPLLEHYLSNLGPVVATADVNGDGLTDLYVGGSSGITGRIFIQNKKQQFQESPQPDFELDRAMEDGGCAFFDINGDGAADLYVSSGSNEFSDARMYQDRVYLNDGKGHFMRNKEVLPAIGSSTSCVVPFDMDKDGDLDVFVGGFAQYNHYPLAHSSILLENRDGRLVDASNRLPESGDLGIVHDAVWMDDRLVIAAEWQPLVMLKKDEKGHFVKADVEALASTGGWWNCLAVVDADQDGDMDLLAGNRGDNSVFTASAAHPASIYWGDFDQNGDLDALPVYYYAVDGQYYPRHGRDQLFMQIKKTRRDFPDYMSYSKASVEQIIPDLTHHLEAHTFSSMYLENKGNGQWSMVALPVEAQFSYVQDILMKDITGDQQPEAILVGNQYGVDVEMGRSDASMGLVLRFENGAWKTLSTQKSGLHTRGKDARCIVEVDERKLLIFNNNEAVQSFTLTLP